MFQSAFSSWWRENVSEYEKLPMSKLQENYTGDGIELKTTAGASGAAWRSGKTRRRLT